MSMMVFTSRIQIEVHVLYLNQMKPTNATESHLDTISVSDGVVVTWYFNSCTLVIFHVLRCAKKLVEV